MPLTVQFWGTRGSIPSPGPSTVRYGGNTPCVELRTEDGWLVILDAGTGIRELGRSLMTMTVPPGMPGTLNVVSTVITAMVTICAALRSTP